jgi:NurA domain-containing protein
MLVRFSDRSNVWIDELVKIATGKIGNHSAEGLFVPVREELPYELANDKLSEDDLETPIDRMEWSGSQTYFATTQPATTVSDTVVAVDAGVIDLGELSTGGTIFAVRGAAFCYPPSNDQPFVCLYNTGVIAIDRNNKYPVFHYIGSRLGLESLYVSVLDSPPYYLPKGSMLDTPNQIQDRCRNFIERIIQEEAISILESFGGGVLLIDGALAGGGGTFDTPETYIRQLLDRCFRHNISVVGISKKTRILIDGRPISSLFNEQPDFTGYVPLKEVLEDERLTAAGMGRSVRSVEALSVAQEMYAVRFSFAPPGLTFRVDVNAAEGMLAPEVLNQVYSNCQIYGGYPRPLIEAHQFSSFLYQDVQTLLADAIVRLGVRPQEKPSMEVIFQPFGGGFK